MQIALVLAVSMLIFATIASMVVEMLHKLMRRRKRGLRKMLYVIPEDPRAAFKAVIRANWILGNIGANADNSLYLYYHSFYLENSD